MKETILLFHLEDSKARLALETALFPFRVRIKTIKPEQYCQTLGALAGIETELEDAQYNGSELDAPMLIFAGIPDNKLNQMLQSLRKKGVQLPYKAILTPTNASWTPTACFEEIKKEHEIMHAKKD